jgi:nitrogen-specific signal transduction histidine kinase
MPYFIEKIYDLLLPHEFQLLLWVFITCCFVCFFSVVYRLRQLQTISNDLRRHNLQLKILMQNQSDLWALWWKNEQILSCSSELYKKFGVTHNAPMSPKYIKYLFEQFDYKAFFKVTHSGEVYTQECKSSGEESFFYISGSAKRIKDDWCYTLWFRNISHQKSKAELHSDIIGELRTERDIMKDILDNVPLPIWYKNLQKKLLFCNKAYANTLETSPDQAVVDQILLKSWQQGGRAPDLTEQVLKTKQPQSQKSHIVIKNERHYVEFSETITKKGFILGYLNDLSEQETLQQEVSHLAKSTHEILEVISLPVIIYNTNKQVEFFNNPFIKMFELDPAWLETKPTFSEVLEELRAKRKLPDTEDFQVYKNRRLACFNNLLEPIEDIAYYPDGRTVRMVTAPYHNGGLMITLNDITDWLTLERRYNTLLAVHRQVADNLFEGLVVFGSDHKLQLYNSAFCKMWDYNEADLSPPPHLEAIIDKIKTRIDYQHYDASWDNFKKRIRSKIIDRSSNKEGRIKLYNDLVYDYSYTPLPDGSNLLTFLDISDRYRIEKNLLERSEALELAHGIKSDFISMIHQGIKYPLRRILLSFTDILEKKYGDINSNYQERLKNSWEEVDHILRFIENANDLASIESGNTSLSKEKINIIQVIDDIKTTLVEIALEKNIQISLNYNKEDIFLLQGDLRRLKQVFFNLLRNAISFAVNNEFISIQITDLPEELQVEISNATAMIPYEDTYGASKKLKKGESIITGLGFSLIKKIVTLHGGNVTLNHQKGTVVKCMFSKKHN